MISNPWSLAPYWERRVSINSWVAAAYASLFPADASRIAIIFSVQKNNLGELHLTPMSLNVTGFGISMNGGDAPVMIDMQSFGGLTTCEWFVSATGGGGNLTVIESFYRPYIIGADKQE